MDLQAVLKSLIAVTGGIAALALIGWLTEGTGADGNKRKNGGGAAGARRSQFNPEDFAQMTPKQQQELLMQMQQQQGVGGPAAGMLGAGQPAAAIPPRLEQALMELLSKAEKFSAKGQIAKAEACYLEAIELIESEEAFGQNHPYLALTCYALGLMAKEHQDYQKSIQYLLRAVSVFEEAKGPETIDHLADALAILAEVYISTKEYEKAEDPLQKSIGLMLGKLSLVNDFTPRNSQENQEKLETIAKINKFLGILYDSQSKLKFEQKKYEEAEEFGKHALVLLLDAFQGEPSAHPFLTRSLLRMAQIFLARGKTVEASNLFDKIIKEQEESGQGTKTTASFARVIGDICLNWNAFDFAETYFEKAKSLLENEDKAKEVTELLATLPELLALKRYKSNDTEADALKASLEELVPLSKIPIPFSHSRYLKTDVASIEFTESEPPKPYFKISLLKKDEQSLSDEAILVVKYPNEEVVVPASGSTIRSQSSELSQVAPGLYEIYVSVYSDSSRTTELGKHPIAIYQAFDSSAATTKTELEQLIADSKAKN